MQIDCMLAIIIKSAVYKQHSAEIRAQSRIIPVCAQRFPQGNPLQRLLVEAGEIERTSELGRKLSFAFFLLQFAPSPFVSMRRDNCKIFRFPCKLFLGNYSTLL